MNNSKRPITLDTDNINYLINKSNTIFVDILIE